MCSVVNEPFSRGALCLEWIFVRFFQGRCNVLAVVVVALYCCSSVVVLVFVQVTCVFWGGRGVVEVCMHTVCIVSSHVNSTLICTSFRNECCRFPPNAVIWCLK